MISMLALLADSPNPNPGRIANESWAFMEALLAMEAETENAGIWVNKPGYHGTRDENQARDAVDGSVNYSVMHPLDLYGPSDKAAGYDWTHLKAQRGDYSSMRRYGDRLHAAWKAQDPRLYGWREAQGMITGSSDPVDLNFAADGWKMGSTPALTHKWHWHLSEHRAYVGSWDNKLCKLSVLRGESLQTYLANGGKLLIPTGAGMEQNEILKYQTGYPGRVIGQLFADWQNFRDWWYSDPKTVNAPPPNSRAAVMYEAVVRIDRNLTLLLERIGDGGAPAEVGLNETTMDALRVMVADVLAVGLETGSNGLRGGSGPT